MESSTARAILRCADFPVFVRKAANMVRDITQAEIMSDLPVNVLRLLLCLPVALAAEWPSVTLPFHLFSGETARKHLPATMGGGIAVFDFDGDGKLDLFLANGGELPGGSRKYAAQSNKLLRNVGEFRFDDVTAKAGVGGTEYSFGASAADYDGDGRPDLLVTHLRGVTLYRNKGNGTFEDVTPRSGIDNKGRWAVGAAWFDYDGDGDLDLFVVNYVAWDPKMERECRVSGRVDFCHPRFYAAQPGALFRNDGNGRFTDVSDASGIGKHAGKGMGAAVADFNGDGRLDLFVTNDRLPAFFFANRGNGRFEETAFDLGLAVPQDGRPVSGMGTDAQDFDGDGRPDLIYTALRDETFPLYRGVASGFEDAGAASRMAPHSRPYAGWGVMFADLDQDGRLDVVSATSDALSGKVDEARRGPVVWFRNAGSGKFEPARTLAAPAMHRGIVAADFNGDGCLDLVVSALDAPAKILRNPCQGGGRAAPRQPLGSSAVGYASSLWDSGKQR